MARACILNPSVLFFDEPTSALDVSSAREVADLIETIAKKGIGVVIISHDESFCSMLNARTIVVKDGTIE